MEPELGQAWTPPRTSLGMICHSVLWIYCIEVRERNSLSTRLAKREAQNFAATVGILLPQENSLTAECSPAERQPQGHFWAPRSICVSSQPNVWTFQLHKQVDSFFSSACVSWSTVSFTWKVNFLTRFFSHVVHFISLENCYFCLSVFNFSLRSHLLLFILNM